MFVELGCISTNIEYTVTYMGGENRHYSMHTSLFLYVGNFILFCQ